MKARARAKDGIVEVKVLIGHPMETGLRRDEDGNRIPANYIERLTATIDGRKVFVANLGPGVSEDPYLEFHCKGESGDVMDLVWTDNLLNSESFRLNVK